MVLLNWLRSDKGMLSLGLAVAILLLAKFHITVLTKFHFQWADMDQVSMWAAVHEMREGFFHMPRYWGQNYGSMLEAWIAIPFSSIPYPKLLPMSAYFLLLLPYLVISGTGFFRFDSGLERLKTSLLVVFFLALLPTEYIMIGAMPRDMGTGIAVTALALLFLHKPANFGFVAIGFFCVLGWSFNANAILLGAVLLTFSFFQQGDYSRLKKVLFLGIGCALALGIHLWIDGLYAQHPGWVVHERWAIVFSPEHLWSGLTHLDRHWGRITPVLHGAGWVYLLAFIGLSLLAIWQRNKAILLSLGVLVIIAFFALGITKVHNATDSIFFSHERMFLALPVAFIFLFSRLIFQLNSLKYGFAFVVAMLLSNISTLKSTIKSNLFEGQNHFLNIALVSELEMKCARIEKLYQSTRAEAIFIGPEVNYGSWLLSRSCPCLTEIELMVKPTYERKTWDLQKMDQANFNRILWISPLISDSSLQDFPEIKVRQLEPLFNYNSIFLLEGEHMNPMHVYKELGFKSVAY